MKVASINCEPDDQRCAREYEAVGEFKKAAGIYEKLLKSYANPVPLLDRLMILYRRLKMYDQEIAVISKAIAIHEQHYKPRKLTNDRAKRISKYLGIALGIADEKGSVYFRPEEVLKLEKRKRIAENRRDMEIDTKK